MRKSGRTLFALQAQNATATSADSHKKKLQELDVAIAASSASVASSAATPSTPAPKKPTQQPKAASRTTEESYIDLCAILSSEESISSDTSRKATPKRGRSMSHVPPTPKTTGGVSCAKMAKVGHKVTGPDAGDVELSTPYITLTRYILELMSDPANKVGDYRECSQQRCPYSTGGMMLQRYMLAKRLVQIEHALYRPLKPP